MHGFRLWSVAAALMLTTSVASRAADLPTRPAYAPPPVVVPAFNWTGIYVGINGGYGWGRQDPLSLITDQFDNFDFDINGWMVGGTFGAQIQSGQVVLGVEGDIDWANIKGSSTVVPTILGVPAPFTANLATHITSVSTIRMRVGYAANNWLLYGTGGVAFLGGNTDANLVGVGCSTPGTLACSGSGNRVGIAAGAGIEYGITQNWSAKLEYLWVGAGGIETASLNSVRMGLNFRFGGL
jgi:outer membrane immunogenic protein